jgi:YfiH family protein
MSNWHWRDWNGLSYLTCSLLKDWPHGFFTRNFWPLTPEQLIDVWQHPVNSQVPEVFRVKQVHGNTVLPTSQLTPIGQISGANSTASGSAAETNPPDLKEADGLRTEKADQAVWVASADCSPVLIADITTGQVAAVHSGWRGTAKAIVPEAIRQFIHLNPNQIKNLRIAIGPAIAGEVYQVSQEVAAEVGISIYPENINPEELTVRASVPEALPETLASVLEWLKQIPGTPIFPDREPGKVRLDVRQAISLQLDKIGITSQQIAIAPHCTYQTPEQFFSYRRDGLKKVQWSGIISQ